MILTCSHLRAERNFRASYQSEPIVPRGDNSVDASINTVEILYFRHFARHIQFTGDGEKCRNKQIKKHINVTVRINVVQGKAN